MSMFPGAGASVVRNEEGEAIGWDYPSEYDYESDFHERDYDVYEDESE